MKETGCEHEGARGEMKVAVSRLASDLRRRKLTETGQSMVEMALLLPIFLGLVLSVIEIGRAWSVKQSLTIAAREGARVLVLPYGAGMTYASESDQQTAAINTVTSYLNSSGVPVGTGTQIRVGRVKPGNDSVYNTADDLFETGYTDGKRGERVGIQLTHQFDTALPLILGMFNNLGSETGIAMGVSCYMEHE